jgi:hypothetical protein
MLTGSELKTCNNCTTFVRGNTIDEADICLQVTRGTPNFNHALTDFFHNARRLCCATYASNQSHMVAAQIVSGPQILKISFNMFSWNEKPKSLAKVHHTLQHPDILYLTQFQLHNSLPLRYKFSSVASHNGSGIDRGHYIASVRGQGEQPYAISDSVVSTRSQQQFTESPQRPTKFWVGSQFQTYILMYLREKGHTPANCQKRMVSVLL